MRFCSTILASLFLLSLCATAADSYAAKSSNSTPSSSFSEQAALTNTVACCENGRVVAVNGNTVAVSPGSANVFVYVKPADGWHSTATPTAILSPSNPTDANNFGSSIAIAGNTIVVGCDQATVGSNSLQGALYVFVEPAGGWIDMTETAILTASDGAGNNLLGISAAIDGNVIVGGSTAGAYVFTKPAGGWATGTQTAKLTSTVPSQLGHVAISGNTVVASAEVSAVPQEGGVDVFVEPSTGWADMTETAALSTGVETVSGVVGLAISGNTVVGGEPNISPNGVSHAGAVYVWVKPASGWSNITPTAELTASNGNTNANLGVGVGINSAVIVAGAPLTNVGSNRAQGAVYTFNEPAGGWKNMTQTSELTVAGGTPATLFGFSVGLSGGTLVAGAPFGTTPGAAYIFGQ